MVFFKILFSKCYWKINRQSITRFQKIKVSILTLINGLVGILSLGYISFWGDISIGLKYNAKKRK